MSENPSDLDSLARRFLTLWQDQLQASMADPATGEAFSRAAEAWAPLMQAWAGAMAPGANLARAPQERQSDAAENPFDTPRAKPRGGGGRGFEGQSDAASEGTAGAAPASDALSDRDEFLHELDRRLRRIEERLDQLGAGAEGAGKSPRKRTRKP